MPRAQAWCTIGAVQRARMPSVPSDLFKVPYTYMHMYIHTSIPIKLSYGQKSPGCMHAVLIFTPFLCLIF